MSNRVVAAVLAVGELLEAGEASPFRSVLMPDWTLLNVVASESISDVAVAAAWVLIAELGRAPVVGPAWYPRALPFDGRLACCNCAFDLANPERLTGGS